MGPNDNSGDSLRGLRSRARNALARVRITRRDQVTSEVLSALRDLEYVGTNTVAEIAAWAGLPLPQLTKFEKAVVQRLRLRGWVVTPPPEEADCGLGDPSHRQEDASSTPPQAVPAQQPKSTPSR